MPRRAEVSQKRHRDSPRTFMDMTPTAGAKLDLLATSPRLPDRSLLSRSHFRVSFKPPPNFPKGAVRLRGHPPATDQSGSELAAFSSLVSRHIQKTLDVVSPDKLFQRCGPSKAPKLHRRFSDGGSLKPRFVTVGSVFGHQIKHGCVRVSVAQSGGHRWTHASWMTSPLERCLVAF